MDFRQIVLVICALCVFGGILANAGMIVLLLITSRKKKVRPGGGKSLATDAPPAEHGIQYAATLKDAG